MKAKFNTLNSTKEFNNDSNKKIILTSIVKSGKENFIHKNIAVDSNTSILDYINKIESSIKKFYDSGYEVHSFNDIKFLMWDHVGSASQDSKLKNTSTLPLVLPKVRVGSATKKSKGKKKDIKQNTNNINRRCYHNSPLLQTNTNVAGEVNKNIKVPLRERKYNVITPLKKIDKNIKGYPISTMDVETILINKVQIPIAISFAYFYKNKNIKTIFKLANKILLLNKPEKLYPIYGLDFTVN